MNFDIPCAIIKRFSRFRISLEGFEEQDLIAKCPECNKDLGITSIVGWGNYPLGGYRAMMKPNRRYGLGYKCPKCFTRSCYHISTMFFDEFYFSHLNVG